jgi:DNA-binding response OmpR family regulator
VPPVTHSSPGNTSQGSILLIEEYDALAAAITSALRKFAPGHAVQVAGSLTEAVALAKTVAPELLVIDFDPAFPGLSEFLQNMQKSHPDSCALIIAGKLPPNIATATRSGGAVQFVEKPFDVQDFGAAVQALLGPWREAETHTAHGTLQDLAVTDIVIAQCAGARTVAIELTNGHGKSGEIYLRQGVPAHAEAGRKSGDDALREMLAWQEIEVLERERPRAKRHTIDTGWPDAFVDAFRKAKPRKPKLRPAPKPVERTTPSKPPVKLVIVDDTEMLLIFVEDVLTTSGTEFQITTAPNGLKGIKEIERAKPDLVLCDYSLPDINGDEVCRRLLKKDSTSRIPVLMMSGHVHEMDKAAATLDNVVATIEKPFRSEALVSLVQQVLAEQRPVRKKVAAAKKTAPAPAAAPPSPPAPAQISAIPTTPQETELPPPAPEPVFPADEPTMETEVYAVPDTDEQPLLFEPLTGSEQHPLVDAPPIQPHPAALASEPEPAAPSQSVVDKARRAIEQLRRQIISKEDRPEPSPPPRFASTVPPSPSYERPMPPQPPAPALTTRVLSEGPNEVVLSLFLDVVSVQLTPALRMGSIRAKPSSGEVSLHVVGSAVRGKIPENGFKLGQVGLDAKGRITEMRLIPTQVPFKAAMTQNSLQIGAVSVVPIDSTSRMQLTPAPQTPMTLRLLAQLDLAGVELSSTFQISQIVLRDRGRPIRVTMNSGNEDNGTACETVGVRLDHSAHIAELQLNPLH